MYTEIYIYIYINSVSNFCMNYGSRPGGRLVGENQKQSIRLKEATEEEVKLGLVISSIRGERKISRALIGEEINERKSTFSS